MHLRRQAEFNGMTVNQVDNVISIPKSMHAISREFTDSELAEQCLLEPFELLIINDPPRVSTPVPVAPALDILPSPTGPVPSIELIIDVPTKPPPIPTERPPTPAELLPSPIVPTPTPIERPQTPIELLQSPIVPTPTPTEPPESPVETTSACSESMFLVEDSTLPPAEHMSLIEDNMSPPVEQMSPIVGPSEDAYNPREIEFNRSDMSGKNTKCCLSLQSMLTCSR